MRHHQIAELLARALLEGEWLASHMRERLSVLVGRDQRPWMHALTDAAAMRFEQAPSPAALVAWLGEQDAFWDAIRARVRVRTWPIAPPEMADSPWKVPALATHKELASWLGIDGPRLDVLADRRGLSRAAHEPRMRHYRYIWIPKRDGRHRLLEAPKPMLRTIQRYLLDGIVARIPAHAAAHGFQPGRSIRSFAGPHVRRDVVIRADLQAFFTSVFAARVRGVFRTADYPEGVARTLAALCTHRTPVDVLAAAPTRDAMELARLRTPHLSQGAPTSGALANLAAYRLDCRVAALAAALGATYTRYADDLVLSGSRELGRAAPTIVARLGAIALEEGFSLNLRKTRVMFASDRQRITGVVVNDKLSIARQEIDRLRAILHNCARTGPAPQNREGVADFRAHLLGRISWIASLDPVKGSRLHGMFDRIRWEEP